MLPKIQKILYATDLSDNSKRAFGYAASAAQSFGAQMIVLHVVEPINPNTYMQISSMLGEAEWVNLQIGRDSQLTEEIMKRLKQFCLDLQTDLRSFPLAEDQIMVRKGLPVDEIIEMAAAENVDLIIMGTHGYGLVKDALMGGTVRRLVRRSAIPVMVVPDPEATRHHTENAS
jgi:nucleotide-binding universal stress UspA family protein